MTQSETDAATGPNAKRKGWNVVGWQGLEISAPPDWNLVAYGGDLKAGNIRLDNASLNARGPLGVEVRWSQVKSKLTDADLQKRLNQYFDSITKSAKRSKIAVETKSKEVDDVKRPDRLATRSFTWRADTKAIGRIWYCHECGRVVVAQVIGGGREDFGSVASEILASMECHSQENGWRIWSLYDLQTQIPRDYALKGRPQLMNIYVQLGLARGNSLDTLSIEQWGAANMQLKGSYLDQWFRRKNTTLEPGLLKNPVEGTAKGHPALIFSGLRKDPIYWISTALPQLLRLQRPAIYFSACLWECPESNKIHLVQSLSRRPQPELVQEIVERTRCHC